MMKNKKLFGALVALIGSVAAVGSAFALYMGASVPEDKEIIIGTKVTGDVVLHADVEEADTAHSKLHPGNPNNETRSIEFSAGFTTPEHSAYAQAYFLARLDFAVTSSSADFITFITPNSAIELGTQTTTNKEYSAYWKQWLNSDDLDPGEGVRHSYAITNEGKTITWSKYYPLFKGQDISRFRMDLRLKNNISNAEYLSIAEATYTVNFTVDVAPTLENAEIDPRIGEWKYAYVVGDATGGWEDKEEFRMVPNAQEDGFQWMFTDGTEYGQKLEVGKHFKLHNNGNWCHANDDNRHEWSQSNVGKTIYWSGVNDAEPNIG